MKFELIIGIILISVTSLADEKRIDGIEKFVNNKTIERVNSELDELSRKLQKNEADPERNRKPNLEKDLSKAVGIGNVALTGENLSDIGARIVSGMTKPPLNGEFDFHAIDDRAGSLTTLTSTVIRYTVVDGKISKAKVVDAGFPSAVKDPPELVEIFSADGDPSAANRGLTRYLSQELLVCDLIKKKSLDDRLREIVSKEISGKFQGAVTEQSEVMKKKFTEALLNDPVTKEIVGQQTENLVDVHTHTYTRSKRTFWIFGKKTDEEKELRRIKISLPGRPPLFFDGERLSTYGAHLDKEGHVVAGFNYGPAADCNGGMVSRLRDRVKTLSAGTTNCVDCSVGGSN